MCSVVGLAVRTAHAAPTAEEAQAPPPAEEEAVLGVRINGVERGEIRTVLAEGDVFVERKELEAFGLHGFEAKEVEKRGRRLVSLRSVRPAVRFDIDMENVILRIEAPVDLLPAHRVDLSRAPRDVLRTRRPSFFFNYSPRLTLPPAPPPTFDLFGEAGLAENNRLYYTSARASSVNGVARGLTNITFDDVPSMRRLTLGDTLVSSGPIGATTPLAGITFARQFAIDPYFSPFPTLRYASSTDVPAQMNVYVNGIRVRSETLEPGAFTLDNLRGLAGGGTVRYVLRDALGRETIFALPYYFSPNVLAKGLDDYAVSLGLPRRNVNTESFDYGTPGVLGYYRVGVTDRVTVGGRADATDSRVSGGPVIATTSPFGVFELEGAASAATRDRFGVAGTFAYRYLTRMLNAGASFRAQSNEYATLSLTPERDRSLLQASTTLTVPVSQRASLGSQFTVDVRRDVPDLARVSTLGQAQLTRDINLLAEVALNALNPPRSSLDAFITLAWVPTSDFLASAGIRRTTGNMGGNVQVSKPNNLGEGWGFRGAVDVAQTTQVSVNHRIHAPTNVINYFFDWRPGSATASLEPAGSIVWVQGAGIFFGRPIIDSFAIVRVPGVRGVRTYLNSQEMGRTNKQGDVLVPSMVSYYGSQIRIASEDVPLDYALEKDTVYAAPPHRGAAFVEFGGKRVRYFRGTVLIDTGAEKVVVPTYGELVVKQDTEEFISPLGEGGAFELEGLSPGAHPAEVRFRELRCSFDIQVPQETALLVDLGRLTCHTAR